MQPEMQRTIAWDRPRLERFKRVYARVPNDKDTFMFDGYEFLKGYAKYMIEYLEMVLGNEDAA